MQRMMSTETYCENNDYGQEYVENREGTMSKVDEENYDANDYANMRIIMTRIVMRIMWTRIIMRIIF